MTTKRYEQLGIAFFGLLALVSFYIFSRFTVDDAFITWRYGRNLVEAGIWGYNATNFDLTQAYTNPILAALSIVPAWLGVDMVLFFKGVALLSIGLLYAYLRKVVVHRGLMTLLYVAFLAVPATMVHAFAGLETFIFVGLFGMVLIALVREDFWGAVLGTVVLIFTRPEAWLLVGLVPAYFLYLSWKNAHYRIYPFLDLLRLPFQAGVILGVAFALYLAFHYLHFGYLLPNSFYVKSAASSAWVQSVVPFDLKFIAKFLFFLSPAALLLMTRHKALLVLIAVFFIPHIYNYTSSDLQMNYCDRFVFHVFGPVYLLVAYLAATQEVARRQITFVALSFLLVFAYTSSKTPGLLDMASSYGRNLRSHTMIGKTIAQVREKYGIKSIALSDAGIMPFQARVLTLDNVGLGSALIAHHGSTLDIVEQYHPDLIILRGKPDGVLIDAEKRKKLYQWAMARNYKPMCAVYYRLDFIYGMLARERIPEFQPVCDQSKVNAVSDWEYVVKHISQAPWYSWHE